MGLNFRRYWKFLPEVIYRRWMIPTNQHLYSSEENPDAQWKDWISPGIPRLKCLRKRVIHRLENQLLATASAFTTPPLNAAETMSVPVRDALGGSNGRLRFGWGPFSTGAESRHNRLPPPLSSSSLNELKPMQSKLIRANPNPDESISSVGWGPQPSRSRSFKRSPTASGPK